MIKKAKIPDATIGRLSLYSRYLIEAYEKGVTTVSSQSIADATGVTPAQVRKDLAYFGEFGTRGVGYNSKELYMHIMKILGLDKRWPVAIIGAGNLGRALSQYKGFHERGFDISCIFDNDPKKIGKKLSNINIYHLDVLEEKVKEFKIELGIIAVPAQAAQEVADKLVKAGIRGIMNFAPINITVPDNIVLRRVDLSAQLEYLTYYLEEI
ncbi:MULTISPECIES: redox-sensing transcriptional repressor Rex [Tepidanaerobacter]|uniref:Redox-sensing transcriptional repressor Rex n=1 Tax=Tepidanaerobacter syntrophicus TaxID=224999 RepID=A0A0U9HP21_9FIRM|nr:MULTISPECIES: redox-sensing transcriptional repressor Rex [Tepidanaerobacter]GAQ25855.1 redox-sensing transcriptional repressor [Tepidanaerobacter syntrophicus]GLI19412.1 redox-sensing transcriptional repressor Rex [Tepidanaerobacter syntrophicus]GLI50520.1 redox-sensing transcriptional repressor Rex [Tepidanaerobacter syntrophicus]HHV82794.1 redox-sensing transcriptional repressor Rex [Tepidanaerobacter syntrophicus]